MGGAGPIDCVSPRRGRSRAAILARDTRHEVGLEQIDREAPGGPTAYPGEGSVVAAIV